MRCCIYKERAIVNQRIKLAMGGDKSNPSVVEVLSIACDECPVDGIQVTQACRAVSPTAARTPAPRTPSPSWTTKATIDKSLKCIECGRCVSACPYSAIIKMVAPLREPCKINAISMGENKKATIDNDKCISCGACVYQCPFGAIQDKSYILDAIELLKQSENNQKYKVYAVVAPSISSQFVQVSVEGGLRPEGAGLLQRGGGRPGRGHGGLQGGWRAPRKGLSHLLVLPGLRQLHQKRASPSWPSTSPTMSRPWWRSANTSRSSEPGSKVVFIGPAPPRR